MGYWIIWSARSSSDCGIVRPSALAVFELTASSKRRIHFESEICRLCALQDPVDVVSRATPHPV